MLIAIAPIVVMLIGAAIYVFAVKPELKELGRIFFAAGAFAFAFVIGNTKLGM